MKKILFIATYGDFLATFELSNISIAMELGCEVHCAANFTEENYNRKIDRLKNLGVKLHEVDFARSPFKTKNLTAYANLKKIIRTEKIDILDCHNAVVSVYARLAAKKCKLEKVIYTPHSFFFYKGCPRKNELIYKNVERFFSRYTDILVCINEEDYEAALQMPMRGKAIYVPGVGIDVNEIKSLPKMRGKYCEEFGIPKDSYIMVSVGELISRKNHILALQAFKNANIPNSYYLICGIGELMDELKKEAINLGIENRVVFTGYRKDVKQIMKSSDLFIFPSLQEGLPVALMEAMACGIPCIASKIRGNVDLIDENKGGLLFNPMDAVELCCKMRDISNDTEKSKEFGEFNSTKINTFDIENIQAIMSREYKNIIQ